MYPVPTLTYLGVDEAGVEVETLEAGQGRDGPGHLCLRVDGQQVLRQAQRLQPTVTWEEKVSLGSIDLIILEGVTRLLLSHSGRNCS